MTSVATAAVLAASFVAALPASAQSTAEPSTTDTPPPGVEILLPRGGIPAIFDPVFVPAAEAEVPDNAWILGVVIDGDARAYSLNLLNEHEVVNDVVGGRAVAAVW
jgi:hypothetical protein